MTQYLKIVMHYKQHLKKAYINTHDSLPCVPLWKLRQFGTTPKETKFMHWRGFLKPGLHFERKSTAYTQTILRTWGTFSRPPMPIYAVGIAQVPSVTLLLQYAVFYAWMLDCHWLIARNLCVYAGFKRDI